MKQRIYYFLLVFFGHLRFFFGSIFDFSTHQFSSFQYIFFDISPFSSSFFFPFSFFSLFSLFFLFISFLFFFSSSSLFSFTLLYSLFSPFLLFSLFLFKSFSSSFPFL